MCKTSTDPIQFWPTVSGFGQTDPVRKQAGKQESSGPLLANASQPIRIGSDMFTGCVYIYIKEKQVGIKGPTFSADVFLGGLFLTTERW